MSMILDFWKFLQGKLIGGKSVEVTSSTITEFIDKETYDSLVTEEFAIHSAINIIAFALSKCIFRTYQDHVEHQGDEWYAWNIEPNYNMNASQFIQKLVWNLCYRNECLVVQDNTGNMLIAETYTHNQFALYPDTFTDVTISCDGNGSDFTFARTFQMSDVLFFKLSNKNITLLLRNLCSDYNALLASAIDKFQKSGGERGTLDISAQAMSRQNYGTKSDGTPQTFEDVFSDMMNNRFKTYFGSKNAVIPLFDGFSYTPRGAETSKKATSEIKDVTDITNEIYDKVANAFQIPPALIRGDVSNIAEVSKQLISGGVQPFVTMIAREINRKKYGKRAVLSGSFLKIDVTPIRYMDAFDMAANIDKLLADGMYSIDELRKKIGDEPLLEDWSSKHYLTKNYQGVDTSSNGYDGRASPDDQTYTNIDTAAGGDSNETNNE